MPSSWTIAGPLAICGHDGAPIPEGEPMEVRHNPRVVEAYLGKQG